MNGSYMILQQQANRRVSAKAGQPDHPRHLEHQKYDKRAIIKYSTMHYAY